MLIKPLELISQAVHFYEKNWRALLPYLLFMIIPSVLFSILFFLGIMFGYATMNGFYIPPVVKVVTAIVFVANFIFSIWISIASANMIKDRLVGTTESQGWKHYFVAAQPFIWPFIYTSIFVGFLVMLGLVAFIIPSFIFIMWSIFALYVVIFEGKFGLAALRESKKLVVGRWWAVAWRVTLPLIIFTVIGSVIVYLLGLPFNFMSSQAWADLIRNALSTVVGIIMSPLFAIYLIILYLDVKSKPVSEVNPNI